MLIQFWLIYLVSVCNLQAYQIQDRAATLEADTWPYRELVEGPRHGGGRAGSRQAALRQRQHQKARVFEYGQEEPANVNDEYRSIAEREAQAPDVAPASDLFNRLYDDVDDMQQQLDQMSDDDRTAVLVDLLARVRAGVNRGSRDPPPIPHEDVARGLPSEREGLAPDVVLVSDTLNQLYKDVDDQQNQQDQMGDDERTAVLLEALARAKSDVNWLPPSDPQEDVAEGLPSEQEVQPRHQQQQQEPNDIEQLLAVDGQNDPLLPLYRLIYSDDDTEDKSPSVPIPIQGDLSLTGDREELLSQIADAQKHLLQDYPPADRDQEPALLLQNQISDNDDQEPIQTFQKPVDMEPLLGKYEADNENPDQLEPIQMGTDDWVFARRSARYDVKKPGPRFDQPKHAPPMVGTRTKQAEQGRTRGQPETAPNIPPPKRSQESLSITDGGYTVTHVSNDGNSGRLALITVSLVGIVCATLIFSFTIFLTKRNANLREKFRNLMGSYVETEADYHISSPIKYEPYMVKVAPISPSSSKDTDSAAVSRSEEPVTSNMDISTGHMILSYMEDHLKNKNRLQKEWEALCAYEADVCSQNAATNPVNAKKNRYPDILPYDHSRVILSGESDYINASTITDHDPRNPAYIATQGPLQHTTADFWQMIWEQGSVVIVMLTRLMENGVSMCARYWPEEGSEVYGTYEVHLVSEHIWSDDFLVRSFYLKNLDTNETRTVTQFHFLSWPESGVPATAKAILEFRRKVNKSYRSKSPIVIHCNDGQGRTGTYTLIDMVLNRMAKGAKEIDIAATLEHIRDQRVGLVRTRAQFEYVLKAVSEEVQAILKALQGSAQH